MQMQIESPTTTQQYFAPMEQVFWDDVEAGVIESLLSASTAMVITHMGRQTVYTPYKEAN